MRTPFIQYVDYVLLEPASFGAVKSEGFIGHEHGRINNLSLDAGWG